MRIRRSVAPFDPFKAGVCRRLAAPRRASRGPLAGTANAVTSRDGSIEARGRRRRVLRQSGVATLEVVRRRSSPPAVINTYASRGSGTRSTVGWRLASILDRISTLQCLLQCIYITDKKFHSLQFFVGGQISTVLMKFVPGI